VGDQRELYLSDEQPGEEAPYERLLGAAMAGDGALFTREDAVEAGWAVVDPVLVNHRAAHPYRRHSWGPKGADAPIATDGGWHNPTSDKVPRSRAYASHSGLSMCGTEQTPALAGAHATSGFRRSV